jgi:hypothetical protein
MRNNSQRLQPYDSLNKAEDEFLNKKLSLPYNQSLKSTQMQ